jgi:hypothetical protein
LHIPSPLKQLGLIRADLARMEKALQHSAAQAHYSS